MRANLIVWAMVFEFRVFGIPVRVHAWFPLVAVVLWFLLGGPEGWRGALVWTAIVFQAVLFHELGHALTGRAFGREPHIELVGLVGGLTWWEQGSALSPWKSIVVSLAGPLVGIAIGALTWLAGGAALMEAEAGLYAFSVAALVWTNAGWGLINLIPTLPLDGGQVVAALGDAFKEGKGIRFACYVSFATLLGFTSVAIYYEEPFAIMVIAMFALHVYQILRADRDHVFGSVESVEERAFEALARSDAKAVVRYGSALLTRAEDDDARDEALHLLAWGHFLAGDADFAQESLDALGGRRRPDPALDGAIRLEQGRIKDALDLLEEASERGGTFVENMLLRAYKESGEYLRALSFAKSEHAHALSQGFVEALENWAQERRGVEPSAPMS